MKSWRSVKEKDGLANSHEFNKPARQDEFNSDEHIEKGAAAQGILLP